MQKEIPHPSIPFKEATLVFPHQLYKEHPAICAGRPIILVEENLFFKQFNFHAQKLVLHRASMQFYRDWLIQQGHRIHSYIDSNSENADVRTLIPALKDSGINKIHLAYLNDDWLTRRIIESSKKSEMALKWVSGPDFLNSAEDLEDFVPTRKTYFQTDFYISQRKKRNLLLNADGSPLGGKWTYDSENRAKFPKTEVIPILQWPADNSYVNEAKSYVETHFPGNYGNAADFKYPVTFEEAEKWLNIFLEKRLGKFGIYEDAMVKKEGFLYHSVLSPMLNIGLISPQQIIDKTQAYALRFEIPLNSLEGFIRQVTGWREFIRLVYLREGRKQRTMNFWGFTRKIPSSFWTGTTGIEPIDNVVKKVLDTGYNHHIERLMVLGNFFLLCEFDPREVYRWFMEMYVDAYDWVMVPNVYGMTQFADGGLMTTKPYISGSNYILKMSDYAKGPWTEIWDGLFWRFMHLHRSFFLKNPRLGMLVHTFDKMPETKRETHLNAANNYLQSLDQYSHES